MSSDANRAQLLRDHLSGYLALHSDGKGGTVYRVDGELDLDGLARSLSARADAQPVAWRDVRDERQRQISAEGWTPAHDDTHVQYEMARAAACYILHTADYCGPKAVPRREWPWSAAWFKPRDARSNLVRAGALILAEIERLDRAAPPQAREQDAAQPDCRQIEDSDCRFPNCKCPHAAQPAAEDERAAFEAWWSRITYGPAIPPPDAFGLNALGEYLNPKLQSKWQAWEARAALARSQR